MFWKKSNNHEKIFDLEDWLKTIMSLTFPVLRSRAASCIQSFQGTGATKWCLKQLLVPFDYPTSERNPWLTYVVHSNKRSMEGFNSPRDEGHTYDPGTDMNRKYENG